MGIIKPRNVSSRALPHVAEEADEADEAGGFSVAVPVTSVTPPPGEADAGGARGGAAAADGGGRSASRLIALLQARARAHSDIHSRLPCAYSNAYCAGAGVCA